MKFFYRPAVSWLMFNLCLQLETAHLFDDGVKVSSSDLKIPDYSFNHLAIHKDTGMVFIGTINYLYKLTPDLKQLAKVTPDHNRWTSYNQILTIDYKGNKLIACEISGYGYQCGAYDVIANIQIWTDEERLSTKLADYLDGSIEGRNTLTVAFIGKTKRNINSGNDITLYFASTNNGYSIFKTPIIAKNLTNLYEFKARSTPISDNFKGNIVHGFYSGIYNYFLTAQQSSIVKNGPYISKLIRICDDGDNNGAYWRGYAEIPIECKYNNEQPYNLVQAAHVGKPGLQLQRSLNIGSDDDVLFAVFSKSQEMETTSNSPSNHSALCIYSLKHINSKFTENIQNCFNGNGYRELMKASCVKGTENIDSNFCTSKINMPLDGNMPVTESPIITFNTILTAIVTRPNRNCNDVFIGTNTGHLKKLVMHNLSSVYEDIDLPIDEGFSVNSDLLFSPKKDYLYINTQFNLMRIKVEHCYHHEDYLTCILRTSIFCGWCLSTNKCTSRNECPTHSSSWYPYDFRKQVRITPNNSNQFQIDRVETLQLHIVNLPSINNTLHCTFIIENRTLQTSVTWSMYTPTSDYNAHCPTPELNNMPKVPKNTNYLKATLSIGTSAFNNAATTEITFFDCNTYTSCEACVSSMFSCQWDSKAGKCTYGENNIAHEVFIINDADHPNTCPDSSLPLISSISPQGGPYEGGINITIEGESLGFKFEHINQGIQVAGVACTPHRNMYIPKKSIKCVINQSSSLSEHEGPVVIHLNGAHIRSTQNFKFVDPKIMDIFPKQGPTYGGTVLTIKGENLNFGRSKEVFIGSTSCTVFSCNSSTIQCITAESYGIEKEENVFVKFDGYFRNFTRDTFKYFKDPQKDEEGFNYELKGIPAGGIEILIRDFYPDSPSVQDLSIHIHDGEQTYNSSCRIRRYSPPTRACLSPSISNIGSSSIDAKKPIKMNVSLTGTVNSDNLFISHSHEFLLYPNPEFYYFFNSSVEYSDDNFLFIIGQNIDLACQKSDIIVKFGVYNCEIRSISSNQIICITTFPLEILAQRDSIDIYIGGTFIKNIPKRHIPILENSTMKYFIYGVTFFMASVVLILVIHFIYSHVVKKLQQEVNIMRMEAIAMKQCMKRVIIKNEITLDENSSRILKLPAVEIEYTSVPTNSIGTSEKSEFMLPKDDKWEFPKTNLTLGRYLGEGEFGKVIQGEARNIINENLTTTVAVKMLKDDHSDDDMIDLVSEMEIMKLIGTHVNVLRLLGCCTQNGVLLVITEYAPHGNLREFLRKHLPFDDEITATSLSQEALILFAVQVAEGMEYLASIKCIHRDLAARNILVSDNYILKIADFGLSRDITNKEYYKRKTDDRIPVKWMAPESLYHNMYSTQSDVWSYGILLWEIFSLGGVPYASLTEVGNLYEILRSGHRLEKPLICSSNIFSLMQDCWNWQTKDRPSFSKIAKYLQDELFNLETLGRSNVYQPEREECNGTENEIDQLLQ